MSVMYGNPHSLKEGIETSRPVATVAVPPLSGRVTGSAPQRKPDWCYQTQASCESPCNGPDLWSKVNAECGKNRQSPINIVTKKTKLDERLTPFKFTGYQTLFDSTMKNNGHSVKVSIPITATVSGGNLGETYKAVSSSANKKYDLFTQGLRSIQNTNGNTTLSKISLNQLILSEANMTNYYRYDGSLTTPGCTEAVVWTVFENPIPLDGEQLQAFSNLKFSDGKQMVGTFRPVQPRNGRVVYRSSGVAVVASAVLILVSISAALGLSRMN
ncbi:hypothetical protein cypCar_00039656 [Cyprinus carpio]|nr:hypothetical protein cypCar_00039656 [Cyprinus carpio]